MGSEKIELTGKFDYANGRSAVDGGVSETSNFVFDTESNGGLPVEFGYSLHNGNQALSIGVGKLGHIYQGKSFAYHSSDGEDIYRIGSPDIVFLSSITPELAADMKRFAFEGEEARGFFSRSLDKALSEVGETGE